MCGIAGIVAVPDALGSTATVERMLDRIAHRGPDGRGQKARYSKARTVFLGHLRLAIIDLSEAASQPMVSECGRHTIIFNGEIYNYRELRDELRGTGATFHTDSDTEVLLVALRTWGTAAFNRLNGMWALAYVDCETGKVLLARDRMGVKPLYVYAADGIFAFASEIKAVLEAVGRRLPVNARVVSRYLEQSVLDATNETFFSGITQLPAGHFAEMRLDVSAPEFVARRYWAPPGEAQSNIREEDAIAELRALFQSAVDLRLRSDVPVGLLLSGGVDSSAIAAAMSRTLGRGNVTMLSAVSDDRRYDEELFIDRVSAHLENPVAKVRLSFQADQVWDLFARATWHNDEPLLSFSSVAHLQLMERARDAGVTVILSGQGADELLCGYKKYVPFYARSLGHRHQWYRAAAMLTGFAARGTVLRQFSFGEARRYLPRVFDRRAVDARGPRTREASDPLPLGIGRSTLTERQIRDLTTLSVPVLLHYEDRMSMAHGREIRLPFMDYRLIESILRMPESFKLREGWTKWVFRRAIEPWLPPEIVWRKDKQGFLNPQTEWLRTTLRSRVDALFGGEMLSANAGLVDAAAVRATYARYVNQRDGGSVTFKDVFNCLALEVWARQYEAHLAF